MTISFEQPSNSVEIEPLSGEEPIEDVYWGDSSISLPQEPNTSLLFFYDGPNGVSLIAIQDSGDGSGGEATLDFEGLPADGEWVVQDDHNTNDFRDAPETIKWRWYGCCSDGGAFRGGLNGYVDDTEPPGITVHPNFKHGIDTWIVLSGSLDDPDRFGLNMDESLKLNGGSGTKSGSVTASVATVQFIPGGEENVDKGGHPLNSGLMHVFDGAADLPVYSLENLDDPETLLPYGPVLDSWYYGDMKDEIAADLQKATEPKTGKYFDAFRNERYKNYRHLNEVEVSFDQSDGDIDKSSIEIQFNEGGVEPEDEKISLRGDQTPWSVLVANEINSVRGLVNGDKERAHQEPRFYSYDTDYEFDGVEGVRVLTISGGYVGFGEKIANESANGPINFLSTIWDWDVPDSLAKKATLADRAISPLMDWLAVVPRTWSFIEFVVLADGRRYARVWDASQYPSLFTYVDGERQHMDKMPYNSQEKFNGWLIAFFSRAMAGLTPYQGAVEKYGHSVKNPEQLRSDAEGEFQSTADKLPLTFAASKYIPEMPRATVGLDSEGGSEVDDPTAPFDSKVSVIPSNLIEPE